jgi:deoxycytidylate deaminase
VKKMPFKTLSRIFVTVVLSTTLLGCASANPKQYEGVHNKFVPVGRMVAKRSFHHGILLPNGEVALLGGAGKPYEQTVENYDPETGQFRLTGKLMIARRETTATLLQNGKILITGGSGGYSDCHNENELYDPATGKSRLTGKLNQCRSNHQATLLQNGKVLITGGYAYYETDEEEAKLIGDPDLDISELYNPQTESFTVAANMNDRRSGHQATLLKDGNVLVTGGVGSPKAIGGGIKVQNILDSAELYLAKENRFVQLPKMIYPAPNHLAKLLINGEVLIIHVSPEDYLDFPKSFLEIFNPVTREFRKAGYIKLKPTGSYDHIYGISGATLLSNGKVLIVTQRYSQIYNPKTQTAVDGPERLYRWGNYSQIRLKNGDVLITRGYNIESFLEPMELYKF